MDSALAIIDRIYAAAAGETPWEEVIRSLQQAVGAASSSLFVLDRPGGGLESLHGNSFDPVVIAAYAAHYHQMDPWIRRLRPERLTEGTPLHIARGESIIPHDEYRRTEFYNDFGRGAGVEWVIGAVGRLGGDSHFQFALQRPAGKDAFDAQALALLQSAGPHLQRALQLREQLRTADAALPARMLDALPVAALVVDSELTLRYANAAAIPLCGPDTGIRLAKGGPRPGAPIGLRLGHSGEMTRLVLLVRSVALNGAPGGAIRLRPEPEGRRFSTALFISPLPSGLPPAGDGVAPGRAPGLALIILRPLDRTMPAPSLLQELFGLTLAEAEVAVGLAGGTRAEVLAERRDRTLATVRAQVRAVLEKTGTGNLRELEALLASLASAAPE
jgi:DNA-binding CsgD family transcriptional regulator